MAQQDVLDYIRNTPHNSNVNVVKGMLDSSDGDSLPEVTSEDNGKVLTVVEGEWDKADASGGGSLLITSDGDKLDKTFGEILEAVQNGTLITLIDSYGKYYQGAKTVQPDSSGGSIEFFNGEMYMASSDDAYPTVYY